ncbi:hypothetical protein O3P69_018440 [Scylla paramamosain]|uniref:Uncharacterized protein n=1 Tax=Scylla paramamosain TaxID=85552 RepID=A0AAW0T276_SCYPA
MPHGRKKAEHRGREETAEHGTSSSPDPDTFLAGASSHLTHAHPSPDQQHSPMDFYAFLTYMKERDDAARVERGEEAARYRAELAEQKREDAARFEALLSRLAPPPASSPAPTPGHPPSVSSHPPQAPVSSSPAGTPPAPKATAQPPPVLPTDVTDEELVQKIVALDASSTLLDVVTLCRAYEATRSAATAIRASPAARAVSQYKKGKKATHKSKAESQRVAPTSSSPCSACGKQQHGPRDAPPQLQSVVAVARQATGLTQRSVLRGTFSATLVTDTDTSKNYASRRRPRRLSGPPSPIIRSRRGITAPHSTLCELRPLTIFPELWRIKLAASGGFSLRLAADPHPRLPSPSSSHVAVCLAASRALAIVPSDFPRQIKTSKTTVNRVGESPDVQPVEASRGVSKPTQEDNILDAETNFSVRSVVTLHAIESLASEDAQASPDQAVTRDLTLEGLRRATLDDPTYSDLLHFVKEGFPSRPVQEARLGNNCDEVDHVLAWRHDLTFLWLGSNDINPNTQPQSLIDMEENEEYGGVRWENPEQGESEVNANQSFHAISPSHDKYPCEVNLRVEDTSSQVCHTRIENELEPQNDVVEGNGTRAERLQRLINQQNWAHLANDQQKQLSNVVLSHEKLFMLEKKDIGTISGEPAHIAVSDPNPCQSPMYRVLWEPRKDSARMMAATWLLMSFILGAVYRSNLKAMLIIPKVNLPFDNLDELYTSGITLGVVEATSMHLDIIDGIEEKTEP